jgi:UDP-N-acetyl-D-mannosaminuronate dehydrogenase
VVATAHKEFVALSPKVFVKNGVGVVVDGRNCLEKDAYLKAGIHFRGIGR